MSRRNASLVVALGVASLAAMVATGELLVESFGRPMPELDPAWSWSWSAARPGGTG